MFNFLGKHVKKKGFCLIYMNKNKKDANFNVTTMDIYCLSHIVSYFIKWITTSWTYSNKIKSRTLVLGRPVHTKYIGVYHMMLLGSYKQFD